jgi:hypothetical protein
MRLQVTGASRGEGLMERSRIVVEVSRTWYWKSEKVVSIMETELVYLESQ